VPAFWIKQDANPGQLHETWAKVDRPGVYFGQCSELCGARHGFMPIAVEAVPQAQYDAWIASKGGHKAGATPAGAPAAATAATPAAAQPNAAEPAVKQPATNQAATANK
jgi:cytochrome c oxidase subunit 2